MKTRGRIVVLLLTVVVGLPLRASDTQTQNSTDSPALSGKQTGERSTTKNFLQRYWEGIANGNIDRTFEKAFDLSFAITPTYTKEGGFGLGGAVTGLYRTNRKDSILVPSNIAIEASAALKGFFSVASRGIHNFSDKHSRLTYSARFTRKSLDLWGIRYDACAVNPPSEYIRTQIKIDADYNYRVGGFFYFGAALNLNYTRAGDMTHPHYLDGQATEYYLSGIGASFMIDTRNNQTNPKKGLYLLLRETVYPRFMGTAQESNWATTFILSGYIPVWKGGVVAGDLYGQFNKENAPWILREEVGGISGRMRGYYAGRYIDSNQLSAQIELRQHVIGRVGCVAWVGAGTVFPSFKSLHWEHILPSFGLGLRIEFKHDVNIRLDFGLGKNTAGFSFGIGEAF